MKALRAVPAPPPRPVRPNILDPNFEYTNAASTDITQTWRRFGWKPLEKTPVNTSKPISPVKTEGTP